MHRTLFIIAALAPLGVAHAQEQRPFAAPAAAPSGAAPSIGSLGEVTLALLLVLAAVFAAAWLLRRVRGFSRAGSAALDVIADLPLGPRERAVLLRVGKTQLLVGVAPGRVNTLHVLDEAIEPASAPVTDVPAERPTFRSLLLKSLGR
jgi:flagellar protein FliO/FliZ